MVEIFQFFSPNTMTRFINIFYKYFTNNGYCKKYLNLLDKQVVLAIKKILDLCLKSHCDRHSNVMIAMAVACWIQLYRDKWKKHPFSSVHGVIKLKGKLYFYGGNFFKFFQNFLKGLLEFLDQPQCFLDILIILKNSRNIPKNSSIVS